MSIYLGHMPNLVGVIPRGSGSVLGLVRELTQETKTFVRQELKLAKTEISGNLPVWRRMGFQWASALS